MAQVEILDPVADDAVGLTTLSPRLTDLRARYWDCEFSGIASTFSVGSWRSVFGRNTGSGMWFTSNLTCFGKRPPGGESPARSRLR